MCALCYRRLYVGTLWPPRSRSIRLPDRTVYIPRYRGSGQVSEILRCVKYEIGMKEVLDFSVLRDAHHHLRTSRPPASWAGDSAGESERIRRANPPIEEARRGRPLRACAALHTHVCEMHILLANRRALARTNVELGMASRIRI